VSDRRSPCPAAEGDLRSGISARSGDLRRTRNRAGVTLLEVLFAILVTSTGLLAAIALFPVALAMARKGRIADLTAVAASSAVSIFDAELMRRPDRWLRWDASTMPPQTQFLPTNFSTAFAGNPFYGKAFCIDPPGFEHNRIEDPSGNYANLWSYFPAVPENAMGPNAAPNASRMIRLTLYNNDPTVGLTIAQKALRPMSFVQADKVFRIEDQLIYERPGDNALPAVQLFTKMAAANTIVPGRRQEEGRLTWFATLVPKLDRLHGVLGEEYVLSIVVCHNRSGEATHVPDPNLNDHPLNEWTAKILGQNGINNSGDFHAGGVGGGEVTLSSMDPNVETGLNQFFYSADALDVKQGSWVLIGRQAMSFVQLPIQVFQWYRISEAEENARYVDVDNDNNQDRYQRDVTLVGPDWQADTTGDGIGEECDVIIMPHVIYVYERTIKIDTGAVP